MPFQDWVLALLGFQTVMIGVGLHILANNVDLGALLPTLKDVQAVLRDARTRGKL